MSLSAPTGAMTSGTRNATASNSAVVNSRGGPKSDVRGSRSEVRGPTSAGKRSRRRSRPYTTQGTAANAKNSGVPSGASVMASAASAAITAAPPQWIRKRNAQSCHGSAGCALVCVGAGLPARKLHPASGAVRRDGLKASVGVHAGSLPLAGHDQLLVQQRRAGRPAHDVVSHGDELVPEDRARAHAADVDRHAASVVHVEPGLRTIRRGVHD